MNRFPEALVEQEVRIRMAFEELALIGQLLDHNTNLNNKQPIKEK